MDTEKLQQIAALAQIMQGIGGDSGLSEVAALNQMGLAQNQDRRADVAASEASQLAALQAQTGQFNLQHMLPQQLANMQDQNQLAKLAHNLAVQQFQRGDHWAAEQARLGRDTLDQRGRIADKEMDFRDRRLDLAAQSEDRIGTNQMLNMLLSAHVMNPMQGAVANWMLGEVGLGQFPLEQMLLLQGGQQGPQVTGDPELNQEFSNMTPEQRRAYMNDPKWGTMAF